MLAQLYGKVLECLEELGFPALLGLKLLFPLRIHDIKVIVQINKLDSMVLQNYLYYLIQKGNNQLFALSSYKHSAL